MLQTACMGEPRGKLPTGRPTEGSAEGSAPLVGVRGGGGGGRDIVSAIAWILLHCVVGRIMQLVCWWVCGCV